MAENGWIAVKEKLPEMNKETSDYFSSKIILMTDGNFSPHIHIRLAAWFLRQVRQFLPMRRRAENPVFIAHNNKFIYLGWFKKKNDAIRVRKKAEVHYKFHPNHGMAR